jgi:hypothetical protein
MIPRNPAELIELPREQTKEMRAVSPEETRRSLDAAAFDPYYALFALLITLGLRPERHSGSNGTTWISIRAKFAYRGRWNAGIISGTSRNPKRLGAAALYLCPRTS